MSSNTRVPVKGVLDFSAEQALVAGLAPGGEGLGVGEPAGVGVVVGGEPDAPHGEAQGPAAKVQHPQQYRDKHAGVITLRLFVVDLVKNSGRGQLRGRVGLDQCLGNCHEQGRGHPLAGHIADTEAQVILIDQEHVVEVAAHLLRRMQCGMYLEAMFIGKYGKRQGQHAHLYFPTNIELALETVLGGAGTLEVFQ